MIKKSRSGAATLGWLLAALLQSLGWFALGFFRDSPIVSEGLMEPSPDSVRVSSLVARFEALRSSSERKSSVWTEPPPPLEGQWWYDFFTPPRVFVHPLTGKLEPNAYQFEIPVQLPPLELEALRHPLFRYQLVGFVEEDARDATRSMLLIEDRQSRQTLRLRFVEGLLLEDGYRTVALAFAQSRQDSGAVSREATLTLQCPEGKTIYLQSGTPAFSHQIVLQLRLGEEVFELPEVGSSKQIGPYIVSWDGILRADALQFECGVSHLPSNTAQSITLTAPVQPDS